MRKLIGASGSVLLAALVVGAIGMGFQAQAYESPIGTLKATPAGTDTTCGAAMQHVKLAIGAYPDSSGVDGSGHPVHPGGNPDWPAFGPSNVYSVPAGSCVTMTVTQYDSGGNLNNPYFGSVIGTVGGKVHVVSSGTNVSQCGGSDPATEVPATFNGDYKSIPACAMGHTFTMRPLPGVSPGFFLSVPLPLAGNYGGDNVGNTSDFPHQTVTFSFVAGAKGAYSWNCEFPCGHGVASFGAVMGAYGYMSGYLHVV